MYCRMCGNKVHNQAVVCVKCGCRPMDGKEYCHSCGTKTRKEQVMCTRCKTSLQGVANPAYNMGININKNAAKNAGKTALKVFGWCSFAIGLLIGIVGLGLLVTGIFSKGFHGAELIGSASKDVSIAVIFFVIWRVCIAQSKKK